MKPNVSFPATGARSSLKRIMNVNYIPFVRSGRSQSLLLMLWVKGGRVMWFKSVVGMTNKVSP